MNNETPKGWYSRGYLPHFDDGVKIQFVTCRLYDSLPQKVLLKFRNELKIRKAEDIDREVVILIEKFLDSGYGECFLKKSEVAEIVGDSLKKFDGERYKLIAWVIWNAVIPDGKQLERRHPDGKIAKQSNQRQTNSC